MNEKILYYPIFPEVGAPGADRSNFVRKWVERFLIPAGLATLDEDKANAYLVATGDSDFMKTARAKYQNGKILVGVNCGTRGFLLNPIAEINQIPEAFTELNLVSVPLIQGTFYPKSGESQIYLAFNDVFCGGNIADWITFAIKGSLAGFPQRCLSGNGVVVSTPQGSTGFALNARGSSAVQPLSSKCWIICGVATGPYPDDTVSPQHITIDVKSRRPVHGYADGYSQEVCNITRVVIEPTDYTVTMGFIKGLDFEARRRTLAQETERGENNM